MKNYDAVTFDTQAIQSHGFRFETGFLKAFYQFKDSCIDVIISTVVEREIIKHLSNNNKESKEKLINAFLEAKKYFPLENSFILSDMQMMNDSDIAEIRVKAFLENIGGKIISENEVSISDILKLYFSNEPPFGGKNKKNEFPDAISLLSIEQWAIENHAKVLAVSDDKDWISYAENSSHIDVVNSLQKALEALQENPLHFESISDNYIKKLFENKNGEYKRIYDYIYVKMNESIFEAEAESPFQWDFEFSDVEIFGWDTAYANCGSSVIQYNDERFSAVVDILIDVRVEGVFSFFMWDSIDKDIYSLGESINGTTMQLDASLILNFSHDKNTGQFHMDDCQIDKDRFSVYFGDVAPQDRYKDDYD